MGLADRLILSRDLREEEQIMKTMAGRTFQMPRIKETPCVWDTLMEPVWTRQGGKATVAGGDIGEAGS